MLRQACAAHIICVTYSFLINGMTPGASSGKGAATHAASASSDSAASALAGVKAKAEPKPKAKGKASAKVKKKPPTVSKSYQDEKDDCLT
jgi:hypothetical protein